MKWRKQGQKKAWQEAGGPDQEGFVADIKELPLYSKSDRGLLRVLSKEMSWPYLPLPENLSPCYVKNWLLSKSGGRGTMKEISLVQEDEGTAHQLSGSGDG